MSSAVFQDEDISTELSSLKNVANNSLISIKFLSLGFPEFFKGLQHIPWTMPARYFSTTTSNP